MGFSQVSTPQLRELVYEQITSALMLGEFKPGESFTITRLAQQVGTSVVPVREAMQRLSAEGAIELLPSRSARIPEFSQDKFQELCRVRTLLEGEATALACAQIESKTLSKLRLLNQKFITAWHKGEIASSMTENKRFHFAIYTAAKAPILTRLIEMMWLRAGPCMAVSFQSAREEHVQAQDPSIHHAAILDALEAGDAEAARANLAADIADFGRRLDQTLYAGEDTAAADES